MTTGTRSNRSLTVAVFRGDGIGPEVMTPCVALVDELVAAAGGLALDWQELPGGADSYRTTGEAMPAASLDAAAAADVILLGAMGDPSIRYPDGREITPQIDLREHFALFAGERPILTWPGLPAPLADPRAHALDFVIIRESTEGFFAGRHTPDVTRERSREFMQITRDASLRLFRHSFELARQRKAQGRPGHVTLVDKANVFASFKFFRDIFDEVAADYPDIATDRRYVDAMAMLMVREPWRFDVVVTENLCGDILSDLGAGLMGGMGMAPSGDIGLDRAVFQPSHGTAPDIAGSGKANPTAMILSAAMMLDWLGRRHDDAALVAGGAKLTAAVKAAFAGGDLVPYELGGTAGLDAITGRVRDALAKAG
jgi:3-isopropylmalate dehydrogenase